MRAAVDRIRHFNRFYTGLIGLLRDRLLDSPVSLAEGRVLWELGAEPGRRARDLAGLLAMDAGQLSRLLTRLAQAGYLRREPDPADRRAARLWLTPAGEALRAELDRRAAAQVETALVGLTTSEVWRLTSAMAEIEDLLSPRQAPPSLPGRL